MANITKQIGDLRVFIEGKFGRNSGTMYTEYFARKKYIEKSVFEILNVNPVYSMSLDSIEEMIRLAQEEIQQLANLKKHLFIKLLAELKEERNNQRVGSE